MVLQPSCTYMYNKTITVNHSIKNRLCHACNGLPAINNIACNALITSFLFFCEFQPAGMSAKAFKLILYNQGCGPVI